jgi:zinc and cadmium transporter
VEPLASIVIFGILMAVIALSGALTLILGQRAMDRLRMPLISLAAGTLISGAAFHLLPSAAAGASGIAIYVWLTVGLISLLAVEMALSTYQQRNSQQRRNTFTKRPMGYLILLADSLHNLIGGIGIGAAFMVDFKLGLTAWLAAALHEIPQELGDFAILIQSGWTKTGALILNFISGLLFLVGGLLAYLWAPKIAEANLMAFAAGNFIYIAVADLIPEIKNESRAGLALVYFCCFVLGVSLLLAVRLTMHA